MRLTISSALSLSLLVVACSSSSGGSSTPCDQNPWECPSAQTCWPQSQSTTSGAVSYACLNAGPGMPGGMCENSVGVPTCGNGLFCFQETSTTPGTCVAYCSTTDPNHACSGHAPCRPVIVGSAGSPPVNVCVSTNVVQGGLDGGTTDGGTTGGDAGTGADGGGTVDGATDAPPGG